MKTFLPILLLTFFFCTNLAGQGNSQASIQKAGGLSKTGNFLQAIELLQTSLKDDPANAELTFNIALNHELLKNTEEAVSYYEQTISLKHTHFQARMRLSNLYVKNKEFSTALKVLNYVCENTEIKEEKLRAKMKIVQIYEENNLNESEFEKHLLDLKSLTNAAHPRIMAAEAKLLYKKKNYNAARELSDNALKMIEKSNDKKSDYEDLYFVNVMSNIYSKNYAGASRFADSLKTEEFLKEYEKVGHSYFYSLGYAYFFSYELEKSLHFLNIALQIKPDFNTARVFLNQIENKNAPKLWAIEATKLKLVEKMAETNSRHEQGDYYNNLARLYLHEKKYPLAARSADSCLNILPDNLEAWYLKGISEYKQNNNDEAIDDLETLVQKAQIAKVNPVKMARYCFMLALAYKRIESPKTAATFRRAKYDIYENAAEYEISALGEQRQ
jgi:tetratricopeptide (TPR) repeat protein